MYTSFGEKVIKVPYGWQLTIASLVYLVFFNKSKEVTLIICLGLSSNRLYAKIDQNNR